MNIVTLKNGSSYDVAFERGKFYISKDFPDKVFICTKIQAVMYLVSLNDGTYLHLQHLEKQHQFLELTSSDEIVIFPG